MYENVLFVVDGYTNGIAGRKYKNVTEAIHDGSYMPWDERRIKSGFSFGNGTIDDLKKFCKDNKATILKSDEFFKILEKKKDTAIDYTFIRAVLHY